ncbi:MAG: GTPase domain-containing protein [Acidobacteria bacterium]|nr:GTPase domain-containing protein [Acidobacteriota bacterium]
MPSINFANKEINCKIVYYGPALSGKTTNLLHVHKALNPQKKSRILSLATQGDRTIFFDFLPVEGKRIKDFLVRFNLYTVPGQVFYNATRKLVLRGVDGIVFVADSQISRQRENEDSMSNLRDNLSKYKKYIEDTPIVIQYNKRDMKNIEEIENMNFMLNKEGKPWFESIATEGKGVIPTLKKIAKLTIKDILKKL